MNDKFLKEHLKEPRPEFTETLYKRISRPMNTQKTIFQPRRLALATITVMTLFVALMLLSPGLQAFAGSLFREIGAIVLIDLKDNPDGSSVSPAPTAVPPTAVPTYYAHDESEIAQYAGFEPLTPAYLPDGYEAQGPWSIVQLDDSMGVYRQYRDASGEHFLIFNPVSHSADARFEQLYGENETVTDITVRSQAGVWITGRLFGDSSETLQQTNWLMWAEDSINYTMYSNVLSLDEMVEIAESLK